MLRREFLSKTTQGAFGALTINVHRSFARQKQPNIFLVIGDDMTWRDCEPYGNNDVKTPNMAQLAREGICFDSMFTSTAMCAPTRQQLYTGLYPVRSGAFPNHSWVYDGVKSLPHYLQQAGYRVGIAGKTHFGPPESFPFETIHGKGHVGEKTIAAVSEFVNRDADQPYCLIVASHQPHKPWDQGDPSAYDAQSLSVPPFLVDCEETRALMTQYYAEVTYLDRQLGECMKIVDHSGQRDNTLFLFTSEQGVQFPFGKWTCYDHGLKTAFIARWPGRIKPGMRTNAMTQYVDVLPTLLEAIGINPSSANPGRPDALGEAGLDGRSFYSVLLGKNDHHRDYVYGAHTTRGIKEGSECYPIRSIRNERFKYIENLNAESEFSNIVTRDEHGILQAWIQKGEKDPAARKRVQFYKKRPSIEFYDLQNDPNELNNIADHQKWGDIQDLLRSQLHDWMKQQGDQRIRTEMEAFKRQGKYLKQSNT